MAKNEKLLEQKIAQIEKEIREQSIPYDYDTKEYPIEVIVSKFNPKSTEQTLFIPDYQRAFVWEPKRQSKFIESLFLGVPIPPILVAVMDDSGKLEIIDGSQRIRTIFRYVSDILKLSDLEELGSLNGTVFSQLQSSRQRKFENISIRFHVVSEKADLAVRADIFDRLNSNGKKLTPSEIRRGAFASNPFYQFIIEMAKSPEFSACVPVTKIDEKEELALRFFAYSEDYLNFKHDVTIFLNRFVEKKGETGFNRNMLTENLYQTLEFIKENIPNGFGKTKNASTIPRVRFEALAVGTYLALKKNPSLKINNISWLDSTDFKRHTTSDASNNRNKLLGRIEFVRDCLLNNNS